MRVLIALVVLVGCHRDRNAPARDDAGSAASPAELPRLPRSADPTEELRILDRRIALHRDIPGDLGVAIGLLRERATIDGRLEDYVEAIALSATWLARSPADPAAWKARVEVLLAVHRFAEARAGLGHVAERDRAALAAALDEATGHPERARSYRETLARDWPRPEHIAQYATHLALTGNLDAALAMMPKAAAAVRDNPPQLLAWLLFQWGRLYEQTGELAAARRFFTASGERLPTLEATVHLIQVLRATGDAARATALAHTAALANPHPELLALAGRIDDARAGWERYVAALPEAFADHAARFYGGPGGDPPRALTLARANLTNRDTAEAHALVVEMALRAGDPGAACDAAVALAEPAAPRAQRFLAWRAFAACKRGDQAARLALDLGIVASPR